MKNNYGVTILETLIAITVGALIIFITLQVVPALMRSSRNNQRRQDVQAILEEDSHFELNNSGAILPSGQAKCGTGGGFPACTAAGQPLFYLLSRKQLSYYLPTNISIVALNPGTSGLTNTTTLDKIVVYNYSKCDASDPKNRTYVGAGYNDIVALFSIEASGGLSRQCTQL